MKKNSYFSLAFFLMFTFLLLNQDAFSQDEKEVFDKVDIMPEYLGGNDEIIRLLISEIK